MQVVTNFDMRNLGHGYNMIIEVCKGKTLALGPGLQDPAKALHRESPIHPNRTAGLNSICKMKRDEEEHAR